MVEASVLLYILKDLSTGHRGVAHRGGQYLAIKETKDYLRVTWIWTYIAFSVCVYTVPSDKRSNDICPYFYLRSLSL